MISSPSSVFMSASSASNASLTNDSVHRKPSRRCMIASRAPTFSRVVSGAVSSASISSADALDFPPLATISSHRRSTPARWSDPTTATTTPGVPCSVYSS